MAKGSLTTKRTLSLLFTQETSLFCRLLTWETFQACYPVLFLADSIYNLFYLLNSVDGVIQKTSLSLTITKVIISFLILYPWKMLFKKTFNKFSFQITNFERWLLSLLFLLYIFPDFQPSTAGSGLYSGHEARETLLLRFGIENLWKLLIFDFCSIHPGIKLIYVGINAYIFFLVSQVDGRLFLNTRFITAGFVTLGIAFLIWKRSRRSKKDSFEEKNRIFKRILSFLPEGILLLDSKGRVRFVNNYLQNLFNPSLTSKHCQITEEFRHIRLSEPSIHLSNGNQHSKNASFLDLSEAAIIQSDKDKLFNKIQYVHNLTSLLDSLSGDLEAWKALEKYILTFQARYLRSNPSQGELSLEIKINIFYKSDDEKYLILLLRDTTERQRIISLENENNAYRNNLIASFSHELRTPLNATLAFLEQAIESFGIPSQIRDSLLKPALISGKFLLSIVNDILDYSQIILNKLELKIQPQNLIQTIEECVELFKEKLVQKDLEFMLRVDELMPNTIFTDHKRVSQILVNLLSNALRFTGKGFIRIRLRLTPENNVLLSVKDTGIGMNDNVQEKLRRKLANGEIKEKVHEASAGIGLGLFISNALAQLICSPGKPGLEFFSKKDHGTEFHFEIENRKPEPSMPPVNRTLLEDDIEEYCQLNKVLVNQYPPTIKYVDENSMRKNNRSIQSRVLIVDDEVFNIMVIENFCRTFHIPTERAFDGKQAIEKIKASMKDGQSPITMVFMDINMPVMDGYEATILMKDLMRRKEINDTLIVGVTAYVSQEMINKCYQSGMVEALNKPLSKEMVMGVLKRHKIIR